VTFRILSATLGTLQPNTIYYYAFSFSSSVSLSLSLSLSLSVSLSLFLSLFSSSRLFCVCALFFFFLIIIIIYYCTYEFFYSVLVFFLNSIFVHRASTYVFARSQWKYLLRVSSLVSSKHLIWTISDVIR